MNIRAILMIAAALVCGASAAFGVSRILRESERGEVETGAVVQAVVDIPRGHMIEAAEVKLGQWPKGMLPQGAISDPEQVVGRITLGQVVAGEPVLDGKLGARDAGRGLAALVPKGMRAYTIVASRAGSSVAGFILPGNKVDVLLNLHGDATDETGGGSTTTLLQSIEILAVDQRLDAPADNRVNPKDLSSVTLLVTPDQAALLDLGQNLGQLALSLRNLADQGQTVTRPATLGDIRSRQGRASLPQLASLALLKGGRAAPSREATPAFYHIMTIRGVQQDDLQIPATAVER